MPAIVIDHEFWVLKFGAPAPPMAAAKFGMVG
jgi:hypothetical protein